MHTTKIEMNFKATLNVITITNIFRARKVTQKHKSEVWLVRCLVKGT